MTCFKSESAFNKENLKANGFILLSEYAKNHNLTSKEIHALRVRSNNNFENFAKYNDRIYIRENYVCEFFAAKKRYKSYVVNVIDVVNVLVKHYQYLSSLITIENGIAFILGNEIKYNGQRAYFNENIDVMFYLRDIIISKEGQDLKYNNTVDYCPNHLISCFN